jgi:hypothetical protein
MKKKTIKILFKKLGREKAAGLAYKEDRVIYIDPGQRGFTLLDTIIHEIIHCQQPDLSEEAVSEFATEMADLLWKSGFRWTDNHR